MSQQIHPNGKHKFTLIVVTSCAPAILALLFITFPQISPFAISKLETALVGYSAVLLGYFSGIRFGATLIIQNTTQNWLIPFLAGPVLGLIILLLPFPLALAVLVAGFGAHGAWDTWASFHGRLPPDYAKIRTAITWIMCTMLIIVLVVDGSGQIDDQLRNLVAT